MLIWAESHGFELWVMYYIFVSLVGTMPPLPPDVGYFGRWAFGALHALCGNWKMAMESIPTFKNMEMAKETMAFEKKIEEKSGTGTGTGDGK